MHRYANPARFRRITDRVLPVALVIAALALAIGLYESLWDSPRDYQQGESVRIMYIHVPAAWVSLFGYLSMAVAGFVGFVWRHPLASLYLRAAAPVAAVLTATCLITGSLWGKPTWGTYWEWDPRLVSMLVQLLLIFGVMALAQAFDDVERGDRAAGLLAMVGVVNLPIIKFSVDWWNSLHQPASVSRIDQAPTEAMNPEMLGPLLIMALAHFALFTALVIWRTRLEIARRVLLRREMVRAAEAEVALSGDLAAAE